MDIEKLLFAIFLSLLVLLGIGVTCILVAVCVTYFVSIEQYSGLIGVILVLVLFVCLVYWFYKNVE